MVWVVNVSDYQQESETFSQQSVQGMGFYADLHHLASELATSSSKEKITSIDHTLANTVFHLLNSTRLLSYSWWHNFC